MNEIRIDVDTLSGYHPPKVVIARNGNVLVNMPADEFVGWLEMLMRHQVECRGHEENRT